MALYKRGKVWHYDFWHGGRRYKASTGQVKKTLAREVELEKRRELREGRFSVKDISFDDLAKEYLRVHAAGKRGREFYEHTVRVLSRTFGGQTVSQITERDIDKFMAQRRAEVAASTANRSLAVLKHMLKLAVRWNHLRVNPAAEVKLQRENNAREWFLKKEEALRLLGVCPAWLQSLVLAALHTGARRGELLALTWGDVDLDGRRITFRQTKNGEPRTLRLSETLKVALEKLCRGVPAAPVFRNKSGKPVHKESVNDAFPRAARKAGLVRTVIDSEGNPKDEAFRFHDLRHTAASWMVQAGVPLNNVREILGHKSLTMTLRYAHLAPDHQEDAMRAVDAMGA